MDAVVDPVSTLAPLSGLISTGIAALLVLTGKLGKLKTKDEVSAAEIKGMKEYATESRKMIISDADDLKNVYKELNDLKTKNALLEYIAKETKELVSEIQNRIGSIDRSLARLNHMEGREGKGAV